MVKFDRIDILENEILNLGADVLEHLLWDHSRDTYTDENGNKCHHHIYWATDNYKHLGEGFDFFDEIQIKSITGKNSQVVRPRAVKSKEEQLTRTKDKAEVFTPSWVCNAQNNLIDEAWFGEKDIFNKEITYSDGVHSWEPRNGNIPFPTKDGKTWKDYVGDVRLEITCGEAPYLVSRYDTTTGDPIDDLKMRIGLLDRKFRVIAENVHTTKDWLYWAKVAIKSTYGYEWQGDSLLLAREAVLYCFIENQKAFYDKIGTRPQNSANTLATIAYIISWNIFQMDGLEYTLPMSGSKSQIIEISLFDEGFETIDTRNQIEKEKIYVKVAEWQKKGIDNKNVQLFKKIK